MKRYRLLGCVVFSLVCGRAGADELTVMSVDPAPNALAAPTNANIVVHFDRPVDRATVTPDSFGAFARWSGTVAGQFVYSDNDQTVTLDTPGAFSSGEQVMVILSHDIHAADGSPLRAAGYSFQFWTRARPAAIALQPNGTLSTNIGAESSRPYGGIASDLNGDGWLDIATVNEDTADLRVFLNTTSNIGAFGELVEPTFPLGAIASPSEPADFDRDGNVDICVANQAAATVSILLGNGDGTFAPQQLVPVGSNPRGIAVLDVDGDGDVDIVNTNYSSSSSLSLLLNNGSGVFGAASFFEGGASGERGLSAADMNGDGILDLVVGAYNSQTVLVLRGNGNGTFTNIGSQSAGGSVWMLATGDVNGDGTADVTVANGQSNTCAVLLNNGSGGLAAPQTLAADPFLLSTDLGDLDGDGDLDWVTASFSGDWRIFLNNGSGTFSFLTEVNAPAAASCALLMDIDNDGDLDLSLVDEIADVVVVMKNSGTTPLGDVDADGIVTLADVALLSECLVGPGDSQPPPGCNPATFAAADSDGDADVDLQDAAALAINFGG